MNPHRPSIFQVGKVTDTGAFVKVHGWGLGLCATRCACHRIDAAGNLAIQEGVGGTLGLRSSLASGEPCTCCEPWQPEELVAILRDLDAINDVEAVDKPTQKEEQS